MKVEVSKEALTALKGIVAWAESDEDPMRMIEEDIPVLIAWLEEVGLLPLDRPRWVPPEDDADRTL